MDEDDFKLAACAALIIAVVMKKKKRKIWVKKWLLARENKSVYNNLFQELRVDDAESYRRYLRMNTDTLQELLQSVTPKLEKRGNDEKAFERRRKINLHASFSCHWRGFF